jgi:hypothetical protein
MNAKQGDTFPAARYLIGARVTLDGKNLGHVIDLEIDPERDFRVSALELGRHGWLDRLHLLRPLAQARSTSPIRLVDWSDVERVEDGRVVCRAGTQVRSETPEDDEPQPPRTESGG